MKVIFHIDDTEKWNLVLDNLKNTLMSDCNFEDIEVLANANAVRDLVQGVNPVIAEKVGDLSRLGVNFKLCNNALKKFNPNGNCPLECVDIVPAGIIELVKKQEAGYSYIKP